MENKASLTALLSSFARIYYATHTANPIFDDSLSEKLLTDTEYATVRQSLLDGQRFFAPEQRFLSDEAALSYIVNTQLAPTPVVRAAYCEESLETAVRTGTTQYVMLGCGLDTFPWRQVELTRKLTVFAVDHPLTLRDFRARIDRAGWAVPDRLRFVPADFTANNLKEALLLQGFDVTQKTFFSWLGVSYYLSPEAISSLLETISSFAAEGSTLLFDYPDDGLFDAREQRVQNMLAMAKAGGEPMQFASGEWELNLLLEEHHFLLYEHLTPAEINDRYFREQPDGLQAFEHVCLALAVLKNTAFINTKEKILQTALLLFAQDGYEAVSIKDIADRLSLTKAALYKHYGSKRDVFDAIVARMEQEDARRAKAFEMPEAPLAESTPEAYRQLRLDTLCRYTEAQFRYWTEDPFASRFRRMLTLEQYRTPELSALYQQYLCDGPLSYTRDILAALLPEAKDAALTSLAFYAPVFLLFSDDDGTKDHAASLSLLRRHLHQFSIQFGKDLNHE